MTHSSTFSQNENSEQIATAYCTFLQMGLQMLKRLPLAVRPVHREDMCHTIPPSHSLTSFIELSSTGSQRTHTHRHRTCAHKWRSPPRTFKR